MSVLQSRDEALRERDGMIPTLEDGGALPPGVAAAALGGLRTPVLAAVWIEADHLRREGRYWALRSRYELIVRLEPRIPSAWGYVGDLMILNIADLAGDPDQAWAWRRDGLEILDRGIAANPESYLLRLQRWTRVLYKIGGDPDMRPRFEAWRGRSVEEEAVRLGRDLGERYPDDPDEVTRVAQVRKAFAFLEFQLADLAAGEDPADARKRYRRAAVGFRAAGEEYRRHPWAAGDFPAYTAALAALAEALVALPAGAERERLVLEKLGPFKDYVEASLLLEPR
jgi:hypothetical protein